MQKCLQMFIKDLVAPLVQITEDAVGVAHVILSCHSKQNLTPFIFQPTGLLIY